jgi:IMP cyclohydrolase
MANSLVTVNCFAAVDDFVFVSMGTYVGVRAYKLE